jgi:hypothetical protein
VRRRPVLARPTNQIAPRSGLAENLACAHINVQELYKRKVAEHCILDGSQNMVNHVANIAWVQHNMEQVPYYLPSLLCPVSVTDVVCTATLPPLPQFMNGKSVPQLPAHSDRAPLCQATTLHLLR